MKQERHTRRASDGKRGVLADSPNAIAEISHGIAAVRQHRIGIAGHRAVGVCLELSAVDASPLGNMRAANARHDVARECAHSVCDKEGKIRGDSRRVCAVCIGV